MIGFQRCTNCVLYNNIVHKRIIKNERAVNLRQENQKLKLQIGKELLNLKAISKLLHYLNSVKSNNILVKWRIFKSKKC
jgi:hypothetical protein